MTAAPLRRGLAALAVLSAAALALSGCLYSQIPKKSIGSGPDKAPSAVGVPAGLEKFYSQELDWSTCETTFSCAEVEVPLDYDNPDGRTIKIAIIRAASTGGEPLGSLLVNPGGPGGSGYDFVANSVDYAVGAPVRKVYDVVGFDPRGVQRSSPVTCYTGTAKDDYLYAVTSAPLFSDEWWSEGEAAAKGFADACEQNSDGILPFITTGNSARDMDVIRAVLGDDQLHYLGYSYGTKLGATYANLFPERAARLVLDGAIDPTLSSTDDSVSQAAGFQRALTAYTDDCLTKTTCPFRGTTEQALTDVQTLLQQLQASPLSLKDGRQVDGYAMALAIFMTLYSEDYWSYLSEAFTAALQGDGSVAMMLVDSYNSRTGPGTYADNSTEAFTAYNCVDEPAASTREEETALLEKVREVAPTFADFWTGPNTCNFWSAPPVGEPGILEAKGAAPIIVIGTTNDPATPYEEAQALASQLDSGVLITRVGDGHTGYNKGNSCVDEAVTEFFVSGVAPKEDLRCE